MPSSISQFSIFNFQLRKYLNCSFHTRQCLFFAQHPRDVEHMRAFPLAYQRQAKS